MAKKNYNLHLKGYVGGWDFDADYVDYVLGKNQDGEVNVLIDSLGGSLAKALSIVAAFRNHGNVNVHFVGMNASAATIASLGAKHVSMDSSAMYLVHKCSMEFFQWASANSDKLFLYKLYKTFLKRVLVSSPLVFTFYIIIEIFYSKFNTTFLHYANCFFIFFAFFLQLLTILIKFPAFGCTFS